MEYQTVDVRIQDVDLLNSKIFENGWMYVGHPSHKNKDVPYFVPYFTNECTSPGLSRITRILCLDFYKIADLLDRKLNFPETPSEQHSLNWRIGLDAIRYRAINENWPSQGFGALFYLDRPESFRSPALTKQAYNASNPDKQIPPTIPTGFILRYEELLVKNSWFLEHSPA